MRAALLASVLVLSACGQKGPLYLPEPAGNVIVRPTQTPAPQDSAKAEDADKAKDRKPAEPPPP